MPLQPMHIEQISSKVEPHGQANRSKRGAPSITSCCSNRALTSGSVWDMVEQFAMFHGLQHQQEVLIQDSVEVHICQLLVTSELKFEKIVAVYRNASCCCDRRWNGSW
ncbi:hypothetical protein ElyMa_002903700 [Elysia marginata]|uniref:Uncharacterized protein n=1 Tax=Elysia marginata TaxID=1093978 RepID=A0AAV4I200_9GAST|nr:hypothetical protein ElyMa_002903700 [Elysia marginata]